MDAHTREVSGPQRLNESAEAAATLAEEHEQLMTEVSRRAEVVLSETDEGRWPIFALRSTTMMSHISASSLPAPSATPLTAAITGLGMSRIARCSASISNSPLREGP